MKRQKIGVILVVLAVSFGLHIYTALAICTDSVNGVIADGESDYITCIDITNDDLDADEGSNNPEPDTIIVNGTINGDVTGEGRGSVIGASDTITVSSTGVVNGDVSGESGGGAIGAPDTITINGTVVGTVVGENGGSVVGAPDLITINGTVTGDVYGEWGGGGTAASDTITIGTGGTVNGNIEADKWTASGSGNDIITILGTVNGNVYGEYNGVATAVGDDTVTVNVDTGNVTGMIDGNLGTNTLILISNTDLDALEALVAVANPASDSISWDSKTFTWLNFSTIITQGSNPSTVAPPMCNTVTDISAPGLPDGVYCRVLMSDGAWMTDAGTVPANLAQANPIVAVDVFRITGQSVTSADFGGYVQICLPGTGRLIFLDARTSPRAEVEITPVEFINGSTCGWIPNAGTLVLIPQ